jgi:hypothetical protein
MLAARRVADLLLDQEAGGKTVICANILEALRPPGRHDQSVAIWQVRFAPNGRLGLAGSQKTGLNTRVLQNASRAVYLSFAALAQGAVSAATLEQGGACVQLSKDGGIGCQFAWLTHAVTRTCGVILEHALSGATSQEPHLDTTLATFTGYCVESGMFSFRVGDEVRISDAESDMLSQS